MNSMQIISVVVFLVVMIALVTEKVHRTAAAVSGAVLLLCLRILSVDEAVSYIDFGTIGVLIGMMLFVAVVRNSGLFEYMAIKSAKIAKGSPWKIMLLFMILTAVLSAFLDNVTTVLLVGPMAISIAGILGIDPVPFLLTQILASNIGGTATLIGDPPNIMIGSKAGLSFADFVVTTGPAVILIMIVICALFYVVYGRRMVVAPERMAAVMELDENRKMKIRQEDGRLEDILKEHLELDKVTLIPCGQGSEIDAAREQWSDGSNTLAIAPGEVVVYTRNYVTNRSLEEAGIRIHAIPSAELSRGRGGPRCMSMPLVRDDP